MTPDSLKEMGHGRVTESAIQIVRDEKVFPRAERLAELFIFAAGMISLLQLLYVLYFYGWTGEKTFANPWLGVFYYLIPGGLAALLFNALRFKQSAKINVALLCLSLFSAAYTAELFFRLTSSGLFAPKYPVMVNLRRSDNKQNEAEKLRKQYKVAIDIRTGIEVVDDLRKRGIDAVPIMSPRPITIKGNEVIPLGAISNKLTVLCNEGGSWVTYNADKRGFNNPNGQWESGHIEIAALGDSFTQGYCVPPEKNFVALIRLRHAATLNLGMAGNGPLQELGILNEHLAALKPKTVLWFYFENDLIDLQAESKSNLLMRYLTDSFKQQALLREQTEIDQALTAEMEREKAESANRERKTRDSLKVGELLEFTKLSVLRKTLGLVQGTSYDEATAAADLRGPIMILFRDILSQAKSRVGAWGGSLYFVYLPGNDVYIEPARKERERILETVRTLGIPLIDIVPAFQAQGDPLSLFPFRGPGHYNEKGHRIVAEEVLRTLRAR